MGFTAEERSEIRRQRALGRSTPRMPRGVAPKTQGPPRPVEEAFAQEAEESRLERKARLERERYERVKKEKKVVSDFFSRCDKLRAYEAEFLRNQQAASDRAREEDEKDE